MAWRGRSCEYGMQVKQVRPRLWSLRRLRNLQCPRSWPDASLFVTIEGGGATDEPDAALSSHQWHRITGTIISMTPRKAAQWQAGEKGYS